LTAARCARGSALSMSSVAFVGATAAVATGRNSSAQRRMADQVA
jgi:hypothetical protein